MITVFDKKALDWLSLFLSERIHNGLRALTMPDGFTAISLAGQSGLLLFDRPNPGFRLAGYSKMDCPHWAAEAENFDYSVQPYIPAPGASLAGSPLVDTVGDVMQVHYDIPGLVYWALCRIEEIDFHETDSHGRYPSSASHAVRFGYLGRPIVDEWCFILSQIILRKWPGLVLNKSEFRVNISHDVDRPSRYAYGALPGFVRTLASDVVRAGGLAAIPPALRVRCGSKKSLHALDPYNTFGWLMTQSEKHGLKSAFYFLCGMTNPRYDGNYDIRAESMRRLFRDIADRDHEIGLHPSYGTFQSPEAVLAEASRLRKVCAEEGIRQVRWGGRMHYLRWEWPVTVRAWAEAGMDYEGSMGYADLPGFRAGTSHDYLAFDPRAGEILPIRIRPLVVMETTIMSPAYLDLGVGEAAFEVLKSLKEVCRSSQGQFNILWHNSSLILSEARALYSSVLSA